MKSIDLVMVGIFKDKIIVKSLGFLRNKLYDYSIPLG